MELTPGYLFGSRAGLESFREQLLADRGRIENEDEPAFDVIIDLLDRCIAQLRTIEHAPWRTPDE